MYYFRHIFKNGQMLQELIGDQSKSVMVYLLFSHHLSREVVLRDTIISLLEAPGARHWKLALTGHFLSRTISENVAFIYGCASIWWGAPNRENSMLRIQFEFFCLFDVMRFNTLRPRRNGHHFFRQHFFVNEYAWISIKISLKFVLRCPVNNIRALVQIMAWCHPDPGDKQLSEPMMVSLLSHIRHSALMT